MKIESYAQGTPSWIDLGTTDVDSAKAFYADILGWTFEETDLGGDGSMVMSMAMKEGSHAAGIYTQRPDEAEMGVPPHWMTYITVDDIDATTARVSALGGNVFAGPFDAFQLFRMSMIADPTGGMVFIYQPNQHVGAGVKSEHGALSWAELLTPDPKTAADFLGNLMGVGVEAGPVGDAEDYTVMMVGAEGVGGIMKMPDHLVERNVPPHWVPYFHVDDVDEAVAKVSAGGGEVLLAPETMESVGRVAVVKDPQGAVFGMITPAEMG